MVIDSMAVADDDMVLRYTPLWFERSGKQSSVVKVGLKTVEIFRVLAATGSLHLYLPSSKILSSS